MTDEQASARATYERLNGAIDATNEAIEANDLLKTLEGMDAAETILREHRVGEFFPDLFYQIRYVRGNILLATGNYALALEAYADVDRRYPQRNNFV